MTMTAPRLILAVGLLLGLAACSDAGEAGDDKAAGHLAAARGYFDAGELRSGRIELRNALQAAPGHPPTLRFLAETAIDIGDPQAAEQALRQLRDNDTAEPADLLLLARVLASSGRADEAERTLEAAGRLPADLQGQGHYVTGLIDAAKGEWSAAQLWARKALAEDADDPGHLLLALRAATATDDPTAAAAHRSALLAVAPEHAPYWLWEGQQALDNGEPAQAELAFRRVADAEADAEVMTQYRSRALQGLAAALSAQGRTDEAAQVAAQIGGAGFDAASLQSQFQDAAFLLQQGQLDEAEALLAPLAEQFPDHPGVAALRGALAYARGNFDAADDLLSSSMAAGGGNAFTAKLLAATRLRLGQPQEAGALLESDLLANLDDPDVAAMRGVNALASGSMESAREELQRALELAPERTALRLQLAAVHARAGDTAAALEVLEPVPADDPLREQSLATRVALLLRAEDVAGAQDVVDQWKEQAPDSQRAALVAAVVAGSAGDRDKAIALTRAAAEAQPDSVAPHLYLGALHAEGDDLTAAAGAYRDALQRDPNNARALQGLFNAIGRTDDEAAAVRAIEGVAADHANAVAPRLLLAQYHLQQSDTRAAIGQLDLLANAAGSNPQVATLAGRMHAVAANQLLGAGDVSAASAQLEQALTLAPTDQTVRLADVQVTARRDGFEAAIGPARRLQEMHGNSHLGFEAEGDIHAQLGNARAAASRYAEAWKRAQNVGLATKRLGVTDPENPAALLADLRAWEDPAQPNTVFILAQAEMQFGNEDAAVEGYEALRAAGAKNPVLLNNLAWVYFTRGDNRAEAVAREAVAAAPESPEILDTLGWILVNKGQRDEGIRLLEQAVSLAPDNAELRAHLDEARSG